MQNPLFQNNQNNLFQRPNQVSNSWGIPNSEPPPQTKVSKAVQGSYRASFKSIVLIVGSDRAQQWTSAIVSQPEYEQYTLIMVRLEDYYLIRAQQIDERHKQSLAKLVNSNQFNRRLIETVNPQSKNIDYQDLPIPIFYKQTNWGNNVPSFNQRDNKSQNFFQSTNTQNQTSNNPFLKQPDNLSAQQDKSPNIFQNAPNNNIFAQTPKPNQSNIWQGQTNNNQPPLGQLAQSQLVYCQPNQPQVGQPAQSAQGSFNQPSQPAQSQQQFALFQNQPSQNTQVQQQQQNQPQPPYNLFQQGNLGLLQNPALAYMTMMQQSSIFPQQFINPMAQMDEETFYQLISAQINNYRKTSSSLAEQIEEYENLKRHEQETRVQQERLLNAETEKRRLERERRNRELERCDWRAQMKPKKQEQKSSQLWPKKIYDTSPQMSQIIFQNRRSHIELYYLESENRITTTLELDFSNPSIKSQILSRIHKLGYFNNDKTYLERSEFEQDENQDPQNSLISLRVISTFRPILTKKGYFTIPDINQMSLSQLKDVKGFIIANEHGSLFWESSTNLMYLNLDKIVEINETYVAVYDFASINEYMKPKEGIKLNKPCIVTLQTNKIQLTEEQLKDQCEQQGAEFLGINQLKKEFSFRVQHFSIYQFLHDEQEQKTEPAKVVQQENVDQQSESFIEKKKAFDEQLKEINQIPVQSTNQKIENFNHRFQGLQVPQQQEIEICVPNKEMLNIDYSFYQQFLNVKTQQMINQNQNQLSVKLIQSLLELNKKIKKIPAEKNIFMERLQYFNILFGNPAILLKDTVQLLEIHQDQLNIENLYEIQQSNYQSVGLSLIMYLEEIIKKRNCKEENLNYEQYVIEQINNNDSLNKKGKLQHIFSFISAKPETQVNLPFYQDDWISCILEWKVKGEYHGNQYSKEWWISLGNLLDRFKIQSSELAALVYFINSKLQKSYDRIYEYLNKNHEEMSFLLESIIFENDKANLLIHKRIMINKISFLVENNEDEFFIHSILDYCNNKLFNVEESQRLKTQILRMQNSLQYKTQFKFQDQDQYLQKLVDQQNYIEVGNYLLKVDHGRFFDYFKYLFEYTIPIQMILGEKQQLLQIIKQIEGKQWRLESRQQQICNLSYIYCHEKPYSQKEFEGFKAKNVYEYQALKLLEEYYFM